MKKNYENPKVEIYELGYDSIELLVMSGLDNNGERYEWDQIIQG